MENKKLHSTHKHLTLVFTGVTFCIILTIAGSFLAARYFNESRIQKREMASQISNISQALENDSNFFQKYTLKKKLDQKKKFSLSGDLSKELQKGQLSFFVLDSDENLVFQQQLQGPKFSKVDFSSQRIYKDNGTFVATRKLPNYSVIFYQNMRYGSDDIFRDFLLLLLLVTLISGGIYFVGSRFVVNALGPVEENIKDMSDFTQNAGHELKTPLAVVRGNLQIMQAEKKLDTKLIKKSIGQIDEMTGLIDGLRELSETGKVEERTQINLPKETKLIVEGLEKIAKEHGITLQGKFPDKFMIYASKQELDIFLSNIIKNAIIYNKKGGSVDISMQKNILTIRDTGAGMSKEDLEKMFDRLYRADSSRNSKGFGIGLSLVKKIADSNNWKTSVQSKLGGGTSFEIIF